MTNDNPAPPPATWRDMVEHIKDLVPDPTNRRKHNPRNLGMVRDALGEVGAARSIVIDEDNVILAGNGVTEAAAEAGITKVEVVEADGETLIAVRRRGLTAEQKRRLAMYDNRSAELATWNAEQLRVDLDFGLTMRPFFTDEELPSVLGATTVIDEDTEGGPIADGPYDSQLGQIYQLGPHRVLCGDSTDVALREALLEGAAPKLWICDPPYDLAYGAWSLLPSIDVVAVWHRSKDAYLWMAQTFAGNEWGVHGLVFTGGVRGQHNSTLPCCMHDFVAIWRRKWWSEKTAAALDAAVIRASGCKRTVDDRPVSWQEHVGGVLTGAESMSWGKPVLENAIVMAYVPAGSVVWDPCAGSGSSLIAAATHGRLWYGAEMQPRWADLIRRRWFTWATAAGVDPGSDALPPVADHPHGPVASADQGTASRPSAIRRARRGKGRAQSDTQPLAS